MDKYKPNDLTTGIFGEQWHLLVSELENTKRDELQRVQVQYLEKIRQIEAGRLRAEKDLDELEDRFSELSEQLRIDTTRLNADLLHAKDETYAARASITDIKNKFVRLEALRDNLDRERLSLLERLEVEGARSTEERQRLEAEKQGLAEQVSTLAGERNLYRNAMILAEQRLKIADQKFLQRLKLAMQNRSGLSRLLILPAAVWNALLPSAGSFRSFTNAWLSQIQPVLASQGVRAAEDFVHKNSSDPISLATGLTRLARMLGRNNHDYALRLANTAAKVDPRPFRRKWLAFMSFDAGFVDQAFDLLLSLPEPNEFKASEKNKAEYIAGCYRLLHDGIEIPERSDETPYIPIPNRILYVAASSLPYHVTGYTQRTQAVLQSLKSEGYDLICVTRPGYPHDRSDAHNLNDCLEQTIGGVTYMALPGPHRRKLGLDRYLIESAEILAEKARSEHVAVIHAASNYEAALPALIAARRLGIPFVYEVRGLWEYTTASKTHGWEKSQRFVMESRLEALTAQNADCVLSISDALVYELVNRGVDRSKIVLAPNAINPEVWLPKQKNEEIANSLGIDAEDFVIGYLGAIVAYEGLDDLVEAIAQLQTRLPQVKTLIVGDGEALPGLKALAEARGLADRIVFTGKIHPDNVSDYYALIDIVAIPRKPFKVCQLVTPLKPLEAMALGIPLVVSDVAAMREIVKDGETGLLQIAGNSRSLADCIDLLARNPQLRQQLAANAQQYVTMHRTWQQVSKSIASAYKTLVSGAGISYTGLESEKSINLEPIKFPAGKNTLSKDDKSLLDHKLAFAARQGMDGLNSFLDIQCDGRSDRFAAFCQLRAAHACLGAGEEQTAMRLTDSALKQDNSATTLRAAAKIYYDSAQLERAMQLVDQLEAVVQEIKSSDRKFIDEVRGRADLAAWAVLPAQPRSIPTTSKRVLNILAFSLPYTSVGYATRSHGLAIGIKNAGWDIRPYTRPGFPHDFKPELVGQGLPDFDEIDGIIYHRIFEFGRKDMSEVQYLHASIAHYERIIRLEQPEVVHAASNYVTALPALIAARRLGVPFVYEIRGFWEITRSSRDEEFKHTPKYRFMQFFEALTARHADAVITITGAMKEELIARGVEADRITIAYNSVDPLRFMPKPRNAQLAAELDIPEGTPVIGYIGSFVDYEGLDDLITACTGLNADGHNFRLLLVGDGTIIDDLKKQSTELNLMGKVIFTGRVPHEKVEDYYSLIDIAPFPRKPWEVCELVSPLKPYEAMALEKAVIVSSTQALKEIVEHRSNGFVFKKGDTKDLQSKLQSLIRDECLKLRVGRDARKWILKDRSWNRAGYCCLKSYYDII